MFERLIVIIIILSLIPAGVVVCGEERIYPAEVLRVIDGDTVDMLVKVGFGIEVRERIRLAAIDAPEMRGDERPAGLKAKAWLEKALDGRDVEIAVEMTRSGDVRRGRYGRVIARILADGVDVGAEMTALGLAEIYDE